MDGLGVLVFRVNWSDPVCAHEQIKRAYDTLRLAGFVMVDVDDPEFADAMRRSALVLDGEDAVPDAPPAGW